MILSNLVRNSFNLGLRKITDQTKMEVFMGIKAFITIFILLRTYSTTILFDFDVAQCHKELNARINEAVVPLGISSREIPEDYSYGIFAFFASIVSYSIVRTTVKFASYFYSFTIEIQELEID